MHQHESPRRCQALNTDGTACSRRVREGQTHCRAHGGDPAEARRSRAAVELPAGLEPRVSLPQLAVALGTTPTTIWRMRRRGEIPEPERLTPGHPSYGLAAARRIIEALRQRAAVPAADGHQDARIAASRAVRGVRQDAGR